jgi:glutamine amidotransferase
MTIFLQSEIEKASKLILPGVGSFDAGIKNLHDFELWSVLNDKVLVQETPVLGICLGVQLMCKRSEEGSLPGFGWFDAEVLRFDKRFESDKPLPVPNMGWRNVDINRQSRLLTNIQENPRFYFVHSYFLSACNKEDIILTAQYGFPFAAALNKRNIYGVQFHPEKSHKFGFALMKTFALLS